jgi:hypothetical protein
MKTNSIDKKNKNKFDKKKLIDDEIEKKIQFHKLFQIKYIKIKKIETKNDR